MSFFWGVCDSQSLVKLTTSTIFKAKFFKDSITTTAY